jgi:cation diffusion facilitator CzcD-associated flavoprotein CzcO
MVKVELTEVIRCSAEAFLDFVMDVERYRDVDDKIGPVSWVRRDGDLIEVKYQPRMPGLALPEPKAVAQLRLTPGRRVDVALAPPPRNQLNHRMGRYQASFACESADAHHIIVTRTVSFDFVPRVRWFFEPIVRRGLPASVRRELNLAKIILERQSAPAASPHNGATSPHNGHGDQPGLGGRPRRHRVVVVGAGLSGIAAAAKLQMAGITDFVVLEQADRVGGTWRANTYPGCAVDIPSPLYSFSFSPNPGWTRNFAGQPELLDYIEDTVRRRRLTPHLRLSTELIEASWSAAEQRWILDTSGGRYVAEHVIFASGLLAEPKIPDVPGLDTFTGEIFHSARWNHDVDLTGKRVAVIGTGCSSVQIVPAIQPAVAELYVFQRTAAWVLPRLDFPFPPAVRWLFRRFPPAQRLLRYQCDLIMRGLAAVATRARLARLLNPVGRQVLKRQVPDPVLRQRLTPTFTVGCKRLLLSNTYLPALGQPNVELIPQALTAVDGQHAVAADGTRRAVDVIVFASGFELRHPPIASRIRCRDGRLLAEAWATRRPEAYLATTVPGVPNGYLILGPNIVMYNSLLALAESQLDYIISAIALTARHGIGALEVREVPFRSFNQRVQRDLGRTVYNQGGCSSFYLDEDGGNFVIWPWSIKRLRDDMSRFDIENYDTVPVSEEETAHV